MPEFQQTQRNRQQVMKRRWINTQDTLNQIPTGSLEEYMRMMVSQQLIPVTVMDSSRWLRMRLLAR